jgi:hypothetical protein
MSNKSGMQRAADAAVMAKRLANIAKAAATAGLKGAAVQTAKEFSPTLIKAVLAIIILLILLPFLIFAALPNIFFRYDENASVDVQAMADKAKIIENAYKFTQDYNEQELNRIVEELSAGYDDVKINREAGSMNQYWYIAICSVAYDQDLFAMDEQDIKDKTIFSYTFDTSEEEYTETQEEVSQTLKRRIINIRELGPEELMTKLEFSDGQKNWARTIYRTMADDQTIRPGDPDYTYDLVDYGNITFTEGQTDVVYYNQGDSRWGSTLYGKYDTIKAAGCGPTSLAMVVSSLTDTPINPEVMSAWAYENGYRCEGSGSFHSLIPEGARHYGINVEYATRYDGQKIADALANGKLVVAIMGAGHFSSSGHFIVLRGVTAEGKILVADSASMNRSAQEWDLSVILDESRRGAAAGGPFWICE